ncbi:hypothetical protein CERSUDRAFT_97298 [Gelatoporia subvermispora B]|uniref:SHSP domain-containing protein n=1 Tax=Ceriporiopsis subvermispora (strain B) TaxID=914234 RepID=M2R7P3_CERS8|nr:hypothetical protein CERSUDRAFT_97298 [Gelatoporia subvermispora B]
MSNQFQQNFVDYSNPTTPRVYTTTWDAEPIHQQQLHEQIPTPTLPQHPLQELQHQLPSPLDEHGFRLPQLDQHQQHQPYQHVPSYAPPHAHAFPTPALQPPGRAHIGMPAAPQGVPSHFRFDNTTQEDFASTHASAVARDERRVERRRGRAATSASASASPGAQTHPVSASARVRAHPYQRPQSVQAGARPRPAASVRTRRTSEMHEAPRAPEADATMAATREGPRTMWAGAAMTASAGASAGAARASGLQGLQGAQGVSSGLTVGCPAAGTWSTRVFSELAGAGVGAGSVGPGAGEGVGAEVPGRGTPAAARYAVGRVCAVIPSDVRFSSVSVSSPTSAGPPGSAHASPQAGTGAEAQVQPQQQEQEHAQLGSDGHSTPQTPTQAIPQDVSRQPQPQPQAQAQAQPRHFTLRADTLYDPIAGMFVAALDLPGVRRADVRLSLRRCPLTRARVLVVAGVRRPTIPAQRHATRECKYGECMRALLVPPHTQVSRPLFRRAAR